MASFEYVKIGDGITPWSNLPYVAGFPGSTGPTGYTGAAGVNGVSGGLTLFLDTASGTANGSSFNIIGTLSSSINEGTQTTVTYTTPVGTPNQTNVPLGLFVTPVGFLTSRSIISGL